MRRILVPLCLLLTVPVTSGPAAAATGAAHGAFSYSYYPILGGEENSACSETSTAGWCFYGWFGVDGPGKTVRLVAGTCAGTFPATLSVTSGFAGHLVVRGTLAIGAGHGVFTGTAVTDTRTVVVEARYDGPLCNIDTTLPIPTHVNGSYDVLSHG